MAVIKEKTQYDVSKSDSYADLVKRLLDDYFSASNLSFWLLGSAGLILILLIGMNYSKENVYFPFFSENKNGLLSLNLVASKSPILQTYNALGENKISFADLLKALLLLFILLMLVKTIWNWIIFPFLKLVAETSSTIWPPLIRIARELTKKITRRYSENKWIADPQPLLVLNQNGKQIYPQLRKRIPLEVRNFKYISFRIKVLGSFSHWRAGIFITSYDDRKDYVFHVYKNEGDNRILSKMTKRIFSRGHINETDKVLQIKDLNNILFRVEGVGDNYYALKINDQEVDRYKVPLEDLKFLEIGAWADDKPYKIELEDIQFEG